MLRVLKTKNRRSKNGDTTMYNLVAAATAAAPVSTTTGYVIFLVSIVVLAGIMRYFIGANNK